MFINERERERGKKTGRKERRRKKQKERDRLLSGIALLKYLLNNPILKNLLFYTLFDVPNRDNKKLDHFIAEIEWSCRWLPKYSTEIF